MSALQQPEEFQFGRKNPRIIKDGGEWYLIANQTETGLSEEVRSGAKPGCIRELIGDNHRARPYRYDKFVSKRQDIQTSEWTFCCHRIDMQGVLAATHANCPHLLFRVFSDQSMGVNTGERFQSEAFKQNKKFTPMENMSETELSENLTGHINGAKGKFLSHWISFTMSPLFAFGLAQDMKRRKNTNIRILIVDTLELPSPLQIFAAEQLILALGVRKTKMENLAAAEFVAWDNVDSPGSIVSLEKFMKAYEIKDGYIKQGYQDLNSSVVRPLCKTSIDMIREDLGKTPVARLRPPSHLRKLNYPKGGFNEVSHQDRKEENSTKWEVHEIGRTFSGETVKGNSNFDCRVPIDAHTLCTIYERVEETFPHNLRFDMLVILLSFRLHHFEYSSIVEMLRNMPGVDRAMPNENGRKYQCYVRGKTTPTLPEVDAYEHLKEDICIVKGIPVHRLSSLPQPRNFKTFQTPWTILPMFDAAAEDRAEDCMEKAKYAFLRRIAKERIEGEERQKRLRYVENRKQACERKALMGSFQFQIISAKQEVLAPMPHSIKNLESEETGTRAEVDYAEDVEAEFDICSDEEEEGGNEEEENFEESEDLEPGEKDILDENLKSKGCVVTGSAEDLRLANIFETAALDLDLKVKKKRPVDTAAPLPSKKRKGLIRDEIKTTQSRHSNLPSMRVSFFYDSAKSGTACHNNITNSAIKLRIDNPTQTNLAYEAFRADPFSNPGGHPNIDYDLKKNEIMPVRSQAYHKNPYFK